MLAQTILILMSQRYYCHGYYCHYFPYRINNLIREHDLQGLDKISMIRKEAI
jgi:hypothetical protein